MMRHLSIAIGLAATLVLSSSSSFAAEEAKFGSEQEAKAMLEKAVAALKDDKAKALAMFNKGEGGFKDRDLYVFCANASDGVLTAHPYLKGELLQDIVGEEGLSPRKSDHGDGRGREDPKRDLLVASPRNRDAAREAHVLHEGRGPDLRGRVLQAVGVRHVHALSLFAASNLGYPRNVRLTEHVPVLVSPFVSPGCIKMGRLLMTWDDEASSASY